MTGDRCMQTITKLVVVGASGHSRVVCDAIASNDCFQIVGLLDKALAEGVMVGAYEVLGPETNLREIRKRRCFDGAVVAIGDNFIRAKVFHSIEELSPSLRFATVVHANAVVAGAASIGPGTVIMAGAIINPGAVIGRNCIVNTGAIVEHDAIIEDHVSLGPGCVLGGGCVVREYSVIGIGCTLIHNLTVGSHSVVGAGSVVTRDVESNVVAYGVPAKSVRLRENGERYL